MNHVDYYQTILASWSRTLWEILYYSCGDDPYFIETRWYERAFKRWDQGLITEKDLQNIWHVYSELDQKRSTNPIADAIFYDIYRVFKISNATKSYFDPSKSKGSSIFICNTRIVPSGVCVCVSVKSL
jgi:hypothetical protein